MAFLPVQEQAFNGLTLNTSALVSGVGISGFSGLTAALVITAVLTLGVLLLLWMVWMGVMRKRSLELQNITLREEYERRKSAEKALQASREMLESIVTVHTEGIVVIDENGNVLFSNPTAANMLGKSPEELQGYHLGMVAGGDVCELDLISGDRSIVEVRSTPLEWSKQPAVLLSMRDISESRRTMRELANSEALLQSTMNSIQDLLVVIDSNYNILLSNWRGLEHLSEEERQAGPKCHQVFRELSIPCPDCHLPHVLESGEPLTFERTSPETGTILEVTASPIIEQGGRITKVVEHLRDVTEERNTRRELAASEQVYRLLTQNIPNGAVHMYDHELNYVVSDGAILEELGLDDASLKNKNIYEILPHEEARRLEPCYRNALEGRKCTEELNFMGRDFELRTLPIEDDKGGIIAGMVLSQDITQRKQAEAELRLSERRFRAVFENAAVGICILAQDGRMLSANQVYRDMLGYTQKEVEPLTTFDMTAHSDRERYKAAFSELVQNRGGQLFIEKDNLRKDGSSFPTRAGLSFVRGGAEENDYIVAMIEDISLRRAGEMELARHHQQLEERVAERTRELRRALMRVKDSRDKVDVILNSIGEGLIVTDNDSKIVLMNSQAEDILGITFAESVGRRVSLAIQDFSYQEKLCRSIGVAQTRTQYQFDFDVYNEDGEERVIRAHTSTILDGQGMQKGVVTIMSDVTRERLIDRMKTEFISTAAHELRTPLTSIQGYTELIATRTGLNMDTIQRYAGVANRMAMQLADIVNDLLDISRIESGKGFSFNRTVVPLNDLIRNRVDVFSQRSEEHVFKTELCPDEDSLALVDVSRTEQVLENILSNAVKYSPEGGEILITCENQGKRLVISIQDQGMGMDNYQLERIYDKFYRANTLGGKIQGTGLGMSIVRYIVEAQKGEVWINSKKGEGTTVSFSLPKSAFDQQQIEHVGQTQTASQASARSEA